MSRKLKLKQASAVLEIRPKQLQNLVQFRVVKPTRSNGTYYFDSGALLVAKIAFYLKEVLGTRTKVLSKLMTAFTASEKKLRARKPSYVIFTCRLGATDQPIKVGVPLRALEEQIERRMERAEIYRDLPRGRKRRGWKAEFLESLTEAAKDLGEVTEAEILRTVSAYRGERRTAEITVAAET